ncbi:MAG: xylulokinase [Phycisphaerae bacterium]
MSKFYFGLDAGTSGLKTVLIDRSGKVVTSNTQNYPVYCPKPLWSEQDPQDWWEAAVKGIRLAMKETRVDPAGIGGIGLSGQMHGSVFLADDLNLKPLRRAILWNDQRTSDQCEHIEKIVGGRKKLIQMVGNPALTGFTAPKILWLRDHEPNIYNKVKHILLPKDYLRLCLTGDYATDVSDASGTLLFDVRKRKWHLELIKKLRLKPEWFAKSYESPQVTGYMNAFAAKLTGLPVGVPVVGGGGDQACGAVGSGIVSKGIVSATLGTSGVVFAYSDTPQFDPEGRVHTMCHAVPGKWCVFGCMLAAGGSFQWFKNTLGRQEMEQAKGRALDPYDLLIDEAKKAPPGCEGLFFLPYLTGERCPHPDPRARACFIGMTARTDRPALIRSVIEGVTFGMKDQIQILHRMGIKIDQVRASGGGANSRFWRQLQSDVYNVPVVTVNVTEGSALGAAILAAVGTGQFKSVPLACGKMIRGIDGLKPNPKLVRLYDKHHKEFQKLYDCLKSEFPVMAGL